MSGEVQLALDDLAALVRQGLPALSVGVHLNVMEELLEERGESGSQEVREFESWRAHFRGPGGRAQTDDGCRSPRGRSGSSALPEPVRYLPGFALVFRPVSAMSTSPEEWTFTAYAVRSFVPFRRVMVLGRQSHAALAEGPILSGPRGWNSVSPPGDGGPPHEGDTMTSARSSGFRATMLSLVAHGGSPRWRHGLARDRRARRSLWSLPLLRDHVWSAR